MKVGADKLPNSTVKMENRSGNTTAMMLSRIQTDVIAYKPDICFILGGTNDITGSTPATTIVSNIEKMVMVLLANKILPVLMTIPPRNTGDALLPLTENANILIRDLANKYALPCADIHSVLVDSSTGRYASGMSTDGLHPTIAGHGKISDAVVSSLSSWLYPRFPLLPVTNANNKNLLKNGLMDDTNADGVPENWFPYGSGAVTHSVLSDSSIKGKWNVMTCSANATGNRIMEQNISSGFNIGDKIAFVGRVATDFEAGSMTGGVDLLFTGTNARLSPLGGGSVGWSATVQSGVWYMERTVPEGTTQLKAQMVVGNGSGSLKVAQMGVYNLTQMGLA
jgi:lysophospholipase L1-like esterase